MRPLRLDMEGFGTFARQCTVDFTDADFFALVGPTGAGKSTVLDAICFALYGRAPRWGSGIEYALAPSATSGKVRLVFSAAGTIYVSTRIVKRGAKGKVTTTSAALERLPGDITEFDLGSIDGVIGTSLASAAKGVSEQIEKIIGLPFDQFTKCVLLPQGAFAEFLHSSAAERRKILENLLGYAVYRDIQQAAGEEHRAAEIVLTHLKQQLDELPAVTDEDFSKAAARIERLREASSQIRQSVPRLDDLTRRTDETAEALSTVDSEAGRLTYIRKPDDASRIAAEATRSAQEVDSAREAVVSAEAEAERLSAATADTDLTKIDRLLTAYDELADIDSKITTGSAMTTEAEDAHEAAVQDRDTDAAEVAAAEEALEAARTADLAATLRGELHPGRDCPVCGQAVEAVPSHASRGELDAANRRLSQARMALAKSERTEAERHKTLLDYRARLDERRRQHDSLRERLAGAAGAEELRAVADTARKDGELLREANQRVKAARETARHHESTHKSLVDRVSVEWQNFDHHRDRVASLGPPPADRGDLALAWDALCEWASQQLEVCRARRGEYAATAAQLESESGKVREELVTLLRQEGVVTSSAETGADFLQVAAAEVSQAEAELSRLENQRERYVDLTAQYAAQAREAQVAKQLHEHLGTRRFVNWLLSEALDELVEGASRILLTLTNGQYDLTYHDNDFYVIDHHDADLKRPAKTLSGGETFAAALALALAMSDQLAGMSSRGACLEAILLDEGFGTLDAATLDQVAASLESLSISGDRMVGVVTHVPALAERIPIRYDVGKDAKGSHVTRVDS